jgi:hypothetical protein
MTFKGIQAKVMDALAAVFPADSDLDSIFWSYDDWREARERVFAARAAKLAASRNAISELELKSKKVQ